MSVLMILIMMGCNAEEKNTSDTSTFDEQDTETNQEPSSPSSEPSEEPQPSSEPGAENRNEPGNEPENEPSNEPGNEPGNEPEDEPLEIIGIYYDQFGTEHSITQARWLINVEGPEEYVYTISQYSNSEGYLIGFNQTTDPNENGFWSRFDYQTSPDILQVCHTTYSAATEEEALNTPAGALDGDCPGYLYSLDPLN